MIETKESAENPQEFVERVLKAINFYYALSWEERKFIVAELEKREATSLKVGGTV